MTAGLPYRLIATDLDGALLTPAETVSDRTRAALATATAAGAVHIVVTGRAVSWARPVLDEIGYTGIAVCGQGAQVYDAGAHKLLTSMTLDRMLGQLALAKLEAELGPLAVAAVQDGLDGAALALGPYRLETAGDFSLRQVLGRAELFAEPISKLFLQHPELTDDQLTAAARGIVGDLVGVTLAGPRIVELLPLGLTKATGLAVAARRLGLRAADTIAFGDMPNDLPMFHWAAHGVAMANAHQELLAVADEVTASNAEDGVATVLERLYG
ncbi:Cof subfamily protein (haloacid dehalogenase superfamily) [Kitasatospora sp. GAS204A]|uniref:HAD family hydrolase n=1 Tax=unclassified Kitasatospora TaxID=2633591 RepID=UPI0024742DFE|nr:HAD family hydrolase [Kitasatospora sp. GAS204B]MDH6119488.1 Cof subfamily protein (haloacid dehalogenase superfamily) [Kitasatospora sp. GAS204B]